MDTQNLQTLDLKSQEYFINMGPQHPAAHGVLRLILTMDGEVVKNIEPDLGFIHRSIEKQCEYEGYKQIIHLTDRLDYLSAHINNEAVALAIEKALEMEVPERVKVIRTIMGELTRIASHLLWWGVMGMDVGALTTFMYAFRDREYINDIMEDTTGARLTMNYSTPGGVMFDLHGDFVKRVKEFIPHLRSVLPKYDELLTGNIIFIKRMKGIGILSPEDAISYGATGPVARGSGVASDVRKIQPYSALDKVNFNEVLLNGGDNLARYNVRMKEMYESLNIIEQLIDNIPDDGIQAKTKALIKLPKGEFFQRVETARGDFGVHIISDGKKNPYRLKFRSPGFSNLNTLIKLGKNTLLGDLIAISATMDFVIPDIDR
jgi:NADH-quinone oxidoreductase subunit D/NADH-quinone oxidoreductase subunit C/D